MQRQGESDVEKAVLARERHFITDVRVDWSKGGAFGGAAEVLSHNLDEVSVDRSISGSMPAEILLSEGAATAELTVKVSGGLILSGQYDGMTMVEVFSEFNPNSPLYGMNPIGSEIYWDVGTVTEDQGIEWIRQFIGNVRDISIDRTSGQVTITALDRAEKLRQPVTLPPWALSEYHAVRGDVLSQLVNTQGVIDSCLKTADTSQTQYRVPTEDELGLSSDLEYEDLHLYITGSGTTLPTVGWKSRLEFDLYHSTETTGITMYERKGASHPSSPDPSKLPLNLRGKSGNDHSLLKYWARDYDRAKWGTSHYFGFTMNTEDPWFQTAPQTIIFRVYTGSDKHFELYVENGVLWTRYIDVQNGDLYIGDPHAIPTGDTHQRVNLLWDTTLQSGIRYRMRIGSTDSGWVSLGTADDVGGVGYLQGLVELWDDLGWSDFYWVSRNVAFPLELVDVFNTTATYVAVLDPGLHELSFYPQRRGVDAWNIISEAASAELGNVFWDENGVFRFWNYKTILAKRETPVKVLTLDEVSALNITRTLDTVRNIISLQRSKKTAIEENAYEAQSVDEFYVPPRTSTTFKVLKNDVVGTNGNQIPRYSTDESNPYGIPIWHDNVVHGYVVQFNDGTGWEEKDNFISGVDIAAHLNDDGHIEFEIWNGYDQEMRLATDDDRPALHVGGARIVDYDDAITTLVDASSVNDYGSRNLNMSGEWIQEHMPTGLISETVLPRISSPIPITQDITVPGDPRIQLADSMDFVDEDGVGVDIRVQVNGYRRSYSPSSGLRDTYSVEAFPKPAFSWNGVVNKWATWDDVVANIDTWDDLVDYYDPLA